MNHEGLAGTIRAPATGGSVGRLIRFARLPPGEKALLVEAAISLSLAGIALRTVAFPRLAKRFGRHMALSPDVEAEEIERRAARVRWAVDVAASNLPWSPVCFPRAVAATAMLRRRGIASTIYFGVDRARELDAHAWVRVGREIVTGGPVEPRFTVVSTFA